MKKENIDEKYPFWICPNCNKDNEISRRFCKKCGKDKPSQDKINIKYYNAKEGTEIKSIYLTNIEPFDWLILITAFFFAAIFFKDLISVNSIDNYINQFVIFTLINGGVLFVAFLRLIFAKTIKLWQRFAVLWISALLNPVSLFILFMIVATIFFEAETGLTKARNIFINKKSLAKACSKIILHSDRYEREYSTNFTGLPDFIVDLRPIRIYIEEKSVTVYEKNFSIRYSWQLKENDENKWNLYSYFNGESDLLIENIIINTNNGKVTIP